MGYSEVTKKSVIAAALAIMGFACVAQAESRTTLLKWDGHATFEVTTPQGHVIVIDPWLNNPTNPAAKDGKDAVDAVPKADYILITHGHFDHVADAVELAKKTKARLVTNFELGTNMVRAMGFPQDQVGMDGLMNAGGEIRILDGEVTVAMTPAIHSSGLDVSKDGKEPVIYGGNPGGFAQDQERSHDLRHRRHGLFRGDDGDRQSVPSGRRSGEHRRALRNGAQ